MAESRGAERKGVPVAAVEHACGLRAACVRPVSGLRPVAKDSGRTGLGGFTVRPGESGARARSGE